MADLEENYVEAADNCLAGYMEEGHLQQEGMKPSDREW